MEIIAWTLVAALGIMLLLVTGRWTRDISKHQKELKQAREDAVKKSRASLEGKVFEQLAPYLPQWTYTPSDARFIATPFDFVIIDGMSAGEPRKVIFLEVKKGTGSNSKLQNQVKKLIQNKEVEWVQLKLD